DSVSVTFSAGSVIGSVEAHDANVVGAVLIAEAAPQINAALSAAINTALPGVVLQALRSNQAFATLTSLPPAIVISISSVDVGAASIAVEVAPGRGGHVFETLLAAVPVPQVVAACKPLLRREELTTARQFTVAATFQGAPVSCKIYYPTSADLIGLANTAL